MATSVPAHCFGLSDRGRIARGLRADLLMVNGDPTHDIKVTREIMAIWRSSVRFDREVYRKRIESNSVKICPLASPKNILND